MELTERTADLTRTVAAVLDMCAHERCSYDDTVELAVPEDDPLFVVDTGRTILLGLVFLAVAHGIENHEKVTQARDILREPRIQPRNVEEVDQWLMVIHHAAHFIVAINYAAMGEERTRDYSRQVVERFAAGDYGDGVRVVPE